jgi:arsenate-mycothiol transferase
MNHPATPSVLFVCVKNSGKSQMAAGLMRKLAGGSVDIYCAGTKPGDVINAFSAESPAEVGVDISDETPKPIDAQLLRDVDFVITLGRKAHVEPVPEPASRTGTPTCRPSAGLTASNECAWYATTLQSASLTS